MSEPVSLLFEPLLESDLLTLLVLVFVIALMPYVAGYYGKVRQQRNLRMEFLFRVGSVLTCASFAVLFFQTYLALPESWQQNQSIMVLTYIASISAGIVIWKISYSLGSGRAVSNMADRKELNRIIVEDDLRPIIKEAADRIISEMKSSFGSLQENYSELTDLIKSENASAEGLMRDRYESLANAIDSYGRTIIGQLNTLINVQTESGFDSEVETELEEYKPSPEEKRLKGIQARRRGEEIQSEVYTMIRMKAGHGEESVCSYDQGEPDIIITRDGKPADVIAVKSYTLTVTDRKGMRNVRGQKVAVSFCPSKDAKAEAEYARGHGLEHIHLIAINIPTKRMIFDGNVELEQTITLRDLKEDS